MSPIINGNTQNINFNQSSGSRSSQDENTAENNRRMMSLMRKKKELIKKMRRAKFGECNYSENSKDSHE